MSGSRNSRKKRRIVSTSPKPATTLHDRRRAHRLVVSDPHVLRGDPVFRSTRVPVHMIAELVGQGSTAHELCKGYPRLTAEMIRLAPVYAAAHPLRRPKRRPPWRGRKPLRQSRRNLDAIVVS